MYTPNKHYEKFTFQDIKEGLRLTFGFNKYILRYWKIQLAILCLGNLSIVLALINPYLGKLILDKGIIARNINSLLVFSLAGFAIFVFSLVLSIAYDYIKNYAIIKIKVDLYREVFKRIKGQSLGQLQKIPSGENLFRVTNDITSAANIINVTLINFVNSLIKIVLITAIIIFLNPVLFLVVLAYQILVISRVAFLTKPMERLTRLSIQQSEGIYKILGTFFAHLYLFKAFGTLGREIGKYMHHLLESLRLTMRRARLSAILNFISSFLDKLFFGILGFYGAVLVIQGRITLGTLGAAVIYVSQGAQAYGTLIDMAGQLVLNKISLERLAFLLEKPITVTPGSIGKAKPEDIRRIKFNNVTFGYQSDKPIFKGMNFVIEPGSHIGLVGYSGCGKTTLLSLLLGLYQPQEGTIIIGERDLLKIDPYYFLDKVGIVLQEPFLLDDTIAHNISYALKNASSEKVKEAADVAEAADFINSLPCGFATLVGENACILSQGQKQRLAIARAIIKNPQVLILDEAMSSLDPLSEARIIETLKQRFKASTIILVSHRVSAIEKMDQAYFFQKPDLIRTGKHKILLEEVPEYKDFFVDQGHHKK